MLKVLVITIFSFIFIGCAAKEPVIIKKIEPKKIENRKLIVESFDKKLNLGMFNRSKDALFNFTYKYFNKEKWYGKKF